MTRTVSGVIYFGFYLFNFFFFRCASYFSQIGISFLFFPAALFVISFFPFLQKNWPSLLGQVAPIRIEYISTHYDNSLDLYLGFLDTRHRCYSQGVFAHDSIVNLGVTEHLPDYGKSLATYQQLLKPGGKIYLDASACREKYKFHSFISKHIYPGNCSPLCLHGYIAELSKTPFRLLGVWDDRHSYMLTARHWAQNLERNRQTIVRTCDESVFRKFHVYLNGTVDLFRRDIMQAYRWVLELP